MNNERERSATLARTSETEMLRRLETLNALTERNRLLWDERVGLVSRLKEMTAILVASETELEPLRSSNNVESTGKLEALSAESHAKNQLEVQQTRTIALQERADRATANEIKKLQTDKEQVQKLLDQMKEAQTKMAAQLNETQRINTQLITDQQKLQEEARSAKEKAAKHQADMAAHVAGNFELSRELHLFARKYRTQYEKLKLEHDKLVEEKEKLAVDLASAATDSGAAASVKEETFNEAAATQAVKIQELEEQMALATAESEQLKQENQTLRASEEKTKNVLKTIRQKYATVTTLQKEKETLTAQLEESRAKIKSLVIQESSRTFVKLIVRRNFGETRSAFSAFQKYFSNTIICSFTFCPHLAPTLTARLCH